MTDSVTCSFCGQSSETSTDEFVASQETQSAICVKCVKTCVDIINESRGVGRNHDTPSNSDPSQ
jgi:ATP-dependent protease Clp ATPase subunit